MKHEEAKIRINKLKDEINHHRYLYHVEDRQEISDGALDSLKKELFKLEMEFPDLITPDSPTQRVGGEPLDKFNKVEHSSRMFSLFDAFSEEDMKDWEQRMVRILVKTTPSPLLQKKGETTPTPPSKGGEYFSPLEGEIKRGSPYKIINYFSDVKLDGIACSLRYEKGFLKLAATRGDGLIGEDITQNIKTIESVPLKLRSIKIDDLIGIGFSKEDVDEVISIIQTANIEVRGEVVMHKKVFKELNEKYKREGKALLANPRNGAAGSVRQLDSKLSADRKLSFYAYEMIIQDDAGNDVFKRQSQKTALAKLLGFRIVKDSKYCADMDEVIKFYRQIEKKRDKLDFEIDGVVVKVDDLSLWPVLGMVGKGPRFMMAYKFSAEQATTKVKEVVWQVGRTGTLTPVATLEPVQVGGVTISHSTLHNMDEIKRLNLKNGDTVIVERSGDVIPKIIQVLSNLRTGEESEIKIPKECPNCGGGVEKIAGEVAYRCVNKNCYAVRLRQMIHYASKGALDIDGLGKKIVEQLMKEGLVKDISDFYDLTVGDLKPLERFADKSAENLVKAINEKKEIELSKFIYGLGIRHVGEETAIALALRIQSGGVEGLKGGGVRVDGAGDLIQEMQKYSVEDLEEMEDVGPVVAKSIYDWFQDNHNIDILHRLEASGVRFKSKKEAKNSELAGKNFVLTGSLSGLTRDEAKAKIREKGGKVSSSVSKKTDYVVAGDEPGSKLGKARELGVKVLGEEEFIDIMK